MPQLSPHNLLSIILFLYITLSLLIMLVNFVNLKILPPRPTNKHKSMSKNITYHYL